MSRRTFAFALVALAARLALFDLSNSAEAEHPAEPRRIGLLLAGASPSGREVQAFREGRSILLRANEVIR